MASYQYDSKTRVARIHFRYGGRQLNKVEPVESERHAQRIVAIVEETLIDLQRGKLAMPADADPKMFILTGGKVVNKPTPTTPSARRDKTKPTESSASEVLEAEPTTVVRAYHKSLTPGTKEANSIETEAIHGRHFESVFGQGWSFDSLDLQKVQDYVDKRAMKGVARETIRKELTTLRTIWGWAAKRGQTQRAPGWKMSDLTLPKMDEKQPFMTWDQITRKIERDQLKGAKAAELWECLWLDEAQTLECLEWVREHARHPFVYPMFAFAAFTGARRSELLRSERDDWDFGAGTVSIREKKADRSKRFTRRSAPIHPALNEVITTWFDVHPGGPWTIATENGEQISPRMATKFFRQTLDYEQPTDAPPAPKVAGKWSVLRGFHVFRHSLASNMASNGVDQRIINEILGHHTEEMERRYRHLLPKKKEHALGSLFRTEARPA